MNGGAKLSDIITQYGQERVSQIITFGTGAARAVIRDMGRVLDLPPGGGQSIKMIPNELGITLEKAFKGKD